MRYIELHLEKIIERIKQHIIASMKYRVLVLADMIDYKNSNNKVSRYTFIILDIFSKTLYIPQKNENTQTFQIFQQYQNDHRSK